MAKKRIAILGGGMAALSAAYQLIKTQALRDANEVTIHQLGWRLGGKAASGRDSQGRNLEHGLHVWFGCYENTFALIQEIYAARQPPTGWALPTWRDAVKPQDFTPIGVQAPGGAWSYWPLTWPNNDGVPGDGTLLPTWWQMIEEIVGWIILFLTGTDEPGEPEAVAAAGPPPTNPAVPAKPSAVLGQARRNLRAIDAQPAAPSAEDLARILAQLAWARDAHARTVAAGAPAASDPGILHDVLDVFVAVVKGIFLDIILPDAPLISLDDIEFRAWLLKHGADPVIVASSSVVRLVYDTLFQYAGGDVARPDLAAGTGLGAVFRIVGTYKGSMMWLVQAGMGEVIVGPVYQQLVSNGVAFNFFHKVVSLEPGPGDAPGAEKVIQTIRIQPQAVTTDAPYNPVMVQDGLVL
ncbi:MAG: NAD(P)-binding protein, partial [Caulobacteraceae bacterium]|nr:NAD(P)-binding protein [Caulobacteraceae bacterium]